MKVVCENLSVEMTKQEIISEIQIGSTIVKPDFRFTLGSEPVKISDISIKNGVFKARIRNPKGDAAVTIEKKKDAIAISANVSPAEAMESTDITGLPVVSGSSRDVRIGISMSLPDSFKFYCFESPNAGRIIDKTMPVGRVYQGNIWAGQPVGLFYNLIAVKIGDNDTLRFTSKAKVTKESKTNSLKSEYMSSMFAIERVENDFILTYEWDPKVPLTIGHFSSPLDTAMEYKEWMIKSYNLVPIEKNPNVPNWVSKLKLIVTFDMYLPSGEIAHNYEHLRKLALDFKKLGVPKNTLFYVAAWLDSMDAGYPEYWPHDDLGGEAKFEEMVKTVHKCGYKIMAHVLPWGLDPYGPYFKQFADCAIVGENAAGFDGWPGGIFTKRVFYHPDKTSPKIVKLSEDKKKITFFTEKVPQDLEAKFVIGGFDVKELKQNTQLFVSIGGRTQKVKMGSFLWSGGEYKLKLNYLFFKGKNEVIITSNEPLNIDTSKIWYEIFDCVMFSMIWTHLIVMADMSRKKWADFVSDKIQKVMNRFKMDAVHLDAMRYWNEEEIFTKMRKEMPGVAFGTEHISEPGLSFFSMTQNGFVAMSKFTGTREPKWLGCYHDLPYQMVKDFVVFYPHLCAANGFVPVGRVCNIKPIRKSIPKIEVEMNWKFLRQSLKFHVIPNIRVNYRDFRLDAETKKFLKEMIIANKSQ